MSVAAVRRVVSRLDPDRPPTDADLVAALAPACADREGAFTELVARYGPMVLGVCRRITGSAHDAEDAFQAVFLVLARRARVIRPAGSVGGWLYGVAVRTAQKAKTAAARRRRREMIATARANPNRPSGPEAHPAEGEAERAELRAVIDAELAALPEMQRAAVVLCDLHGKTRAEAAAELRRPEGTVAAWLARGRKALAARLARRGVALPAAGLGAVVVPSVVAAELATSAVATFLGKSTSASVLALAEGVMRSLSSGASKLGAVLVAAGGALLLAIAAVATAATWRSGDEPKPNAVVKMDHEPESVPVAAPVPKPESDVRAFLDHKGFVYSVSYAPDGTRFVSVGNGTATVWDAATLKKVLTVGAEFAAFSGDGKALFLLTKDEFHIADPTTGKVQRKFARIEPKVPMLVRSVFGCWAAFSGDGLTRIECDGTRQHVTAFPGKSDPPVLADQQNHGSVGSWEIFNHGTGGAFAPGGNSLFAGIHSATTGYKESACLTIWELPSGKRVGTVPHDHDRAVHCFAWAPDASEIVVAYGDSVCVHDPGTLKELRKFKIRGATSVAWSKDGKVLALAVQEPVYEPGDKGVEIVRPNAVLLLDATTGKQLRRIEGFPDNLPIVSLAFRPDGKHLLCGAGFFPGDLPAVNVPQPKRDAPGLRVVPIDTKPEPNSPAWREQSTLELSGWLGGSAVYSADGSTLFVGGTDGRVRAYEVATRKQFWEYKGGGHFAAVALSPDNKTLAVTTKDGVQLLDAATGKPGDTLEEKESEATAVAFFPDEPIFRDGQLLATAHRVIFGSARGYFVKTWLMWPNVSTIKTSSTADKEPTDRFAVPLAIAPGGKRAVVTGPIDKDTGKNVLWAWSAGSKEATKLLDGHKAAVVCASWSKDGQRIVTGDADGTVIIWDAGPFKEKARLELGGRVAALSLSADGMSTAAAVVLPQEGKNYAEQVFVWPTANPPKKPEPISSHQAGGPFRGVAGLAFAPDGKSLVSTFANFDHLSKLGVLVGKVRVFALDEEKPQPAPVAKTVSHAEFGPDGKKYLAVSGGQVSVFDSTTGKQLFTVAGEAARFTADGKKLLVMAEKVLECDPDTGKVLKAHDRPKTKWVWHRVAFAPDGKRFAAHFGMFAAVYDIATGAEAVKLDERYETAGYLVGQPGSQVSFSPDGKYLCAVGALVAKGGVLGTAVWEVPSAKPEGFTATGKRVHVFDAPLDAPLATAFSPGGGELAVGFKDRLEIWALGGAKERPLRSVRVEQPITALAYSGDGKWLALGVRENSFDRWWADVRLAYKGEVHVRPTTLETKPRGFGGFRSDPVLIVDGKVKEPGPAELRGTEGYWLDPLVSALAFSPDGTMILAGAGFPVTDKVPAGILKGGEVKTFHFPVPEKPAPEPAGLQWTDSAVLTDHNALVNGVAVAPDGKSFAAATEKNVTCWDSASHKVLWTYKATEPAALALTYTPDGKHLWVADQSGVIRLDARTGDGAKTLDDLFGKRLENFNLKVKGSRARSLALSQDGRRLAMSDGYLTWMIETETPEGHGTFGGVAPKDAPPIPSGVAWSPDGKRLASISLKATRPPGTISGPAPDSHWPVRIWSTEGEGLVRSLLGHDERVTALAWSKDGNVIASGDEKGTVILWDAATGKELWRRRFRGRDNTDGRINALALSPADNTVAVAVSMGSGKGPERVALLSAADGKDGEHLMRPWSVPVSSLAWSKDGTFLVTGCGSAGQVITETKPLVGEAVIWQRQKP
jgi:RNA polymerase sigma factor (sigma-70 family)